MSAKASLGAAIAKGREQADNRKLGSARKAIARDPSKARLNDRNVHIRAIDKQVRLAHEAEGQAENVLNVILDTIEAVPEMDPEDKSRLLTLGDSTSGDLTKYKARLDALDKQADAFKVSTSTDPLGWTMDSLQICSEADDARTGFVNMIADSLSDVQSTISTIRRKQEQ